MVHHQAKRYHPADYWKIPGLIGDTRTPALKEYIDKPGGKHHTSAVTRKRLIELVTRTKRGLRCYDGDTVTELKHFGLHRGFDAPSLNVKKQALIDILETADEEATFDRFLELPAELRVYIYELHFASYGDHPRAIESAAPPPITQVNSQIRQETLKLFYQTCDFQFVFTSAGPISQLAIENGTAKFVRELPCKHLATIRNMRLGVSWGGTKFGPAGFPGSSGEWALRFSNGNEKIFLEAVRAPRANNKNELRYKRIERTIRRFINKKCTYSKNKKMSEVLANMLFYLNCRR
jgi:hypothetical protein